MKKKFRVWDGIDIRYNGFAVDYNGDIAFLLEDCPDTNDIMLDYERAQYWESLQCTGIKDKNGKEIYEGDILRSEDTGSNYPETMIRIEPVIIHNLNNMTPMLFDKTEYEVIGNIYENPNLIRKEREDG